MLEEGREGDKSVYYNYYTSRTRSNNYVTLTRKHITNIRGKKEEAKNEIYYHLKIFRLKVWQQ